MPKLLSLYHKLPYWAKSLAASAYGYRLWRWRFGPDTERLIREAIEREHWTPQQIAEWQQARLAHVLERAATRVPYYRDYWTSRAPSGASWRVLSDWPLLDKEEVRRCPERFVADDRDRTKMHLDHTSGTSGKPLDLWWSAEMMHRFYAMFEARWRLWYGITRFDRWAILGGQIVASAERRRPPFWVWNAAFRQLYMSSYHLAPDLMGYYLDALARYRVTYLWGYTSSLYALAQHALATGRRDLKMKVVIANAEPVFDFQRQVISEAFSCPTRETYGMAELVAAAGECEADQMHLWPDAGIVEVIERGSSTPPGSQGELVCTGLINDDMPLVRYQLGDRGAINDDVKPCACGRHWARLKSIEGRSDDMLYTRDGRRIGRLDPVFKSRLPIREAQIVQETLDLVRVRFVPAADYVPSAGESIAERLRERMGAIQVQLEPVEQIERTASGKLRAVVCLIPPDEIARLTRQGQTTAPGR